MQYYYNTFVCVHHEKGVSKSLNIYVCINNAIFYAILKDDKDDDNLICVKALQKEATFLVIENFFFVFLRSEHRNLNNTLC